MLLVMGTRLGRGILQVAFALLVDLNSTSMDSPEPVRDLITGDFVIVVLVQMLPTRSKEPAVLPGGLWLSRDTTKTSPINCEVVYTASVRELSICRRPSLISPMVSLPSGRGDAQVGFWV